MLFIHHRINNIRQLADVPVEHGVELDLRDQGGELILQHDPFTDGERFADYLKHYRHGLMILNIKSERIEHRALELLQAHGIENYFFLDSSFPMIRLLSSQGESRIAMRFSEYEPVESCLAMAGKVDWVWVDCFTTMPFEPDSYARLKRHFRFCAVSPELQGRPVTTISQYALQLAPFSVDAVCTKRPDLWQAALGSNARRQAA
ncbi:MAG: hypothetical protein JSS27_06245 [Planctomycetes bacterium]|nr:hypothetical protein [Planctomycetota bacterium]